jgi:hypothetical protein
MVLLKLHRVRISILITAKNVAHKTIAASGDIAAAVFDAICIQQQFEL